MSELTSGNNFGFLLTDTSRLLRQFFEKTMTENGHGLTPGEIRALSNVIRFRGARQSVLAERMGIEPMTLSAYLDRLEAQNFIERQTDPADRRAKLIEPTEAAFALMRELDPLFEEVYTHMSQGLDEAEMTRIATGLRAILANLTNDPQILAHTDLLHSEADPENASKPG